MKLPEIHELIGFPEGANKWSDVRGSNNETNSWPEGGVVPN